MNRTSKLLLVALAGLALVCALAAMGFGIVYLGVKYHA